MNVINQDAEPEKVAEHLEAAVPEVTLIEVHLGDTHPEEVVVREEVHQAALTPSV